MTNLDHQTFRKAFMNEFEKARTEVNKWPPEIKLEARKNSVLVFSLKARDNDGNVETVRPRDGS